MEIRHCPILLTGECGTYSAKGLKSLFNGVKVSPYLDFTMEDSDVEEYSSGVGVLSISGAQEKYSALIEDGIIRLTREGERGTYILKPAPLVKITDRREIPANEHLTMQIASQVYKINTARCGLCFDKNKRPVYITKRYDINPDGTKLNQEDFATLQNKSREQGGIDFKYNGSYFDIACEIKKSVTAWPVALEQFFKAVVFNYIFANGDAHLKNYSVVWNKGEILLSPSYDLINTAMHIGGDDIGLHNGFAPSFDKSDVYAQTGHPCKIDFATFATNIGISPVRSVKLIEQFQTLPPSVTELIGRSYLSTEKHKRNYLRIVEERIKRFNRE